jgi:hypothetical protein
VLVAQGLGAETSHKGKCSEHADLLNRLMHSCYNTDYAAAGIATETPVVCTVRAFRQKFTLEDTIGSYACSLEATTLLTNGISFGCLVLLPVGTVNSVQTLKATPFLSLQLMIS